MKAVMQAKVLNNNRNQLENQSRFYQTIAKILPKMYQKSTKNRSKIDQTSMKNRSKSVPDALLEGSWGHLGPGSQQDARKLRKHRRKTAEKPLKTVQHGLQNRPNWRKNVIKI